MFCLHHQRIPELSYECAKAAYWLMRKYAQKLPSHTRDGPFQIIAGLFFEASQKKAKYLWCVLVVAS
jgi:hypothetical protein